jgi:predicted amidohydrolase YtcJ
MARLSGWRGAGVVQREAHHAARAALHRRWTPQERREALRLALRTAAARGIGTVHELNAPHIAPVDDRLLIGEITDAEPLPEVVCYWGEMYGGDVPGEAVAGFAGDLSVDGSIGSRTAALEQPYVDADTSGHLYLTAEQIAAHLTYCTSRGWQAGFHVIGDRALATVVAGLRAAERDVGREALRQCRHRLEHVEMPSTEAIDTMAELGVLASVQPAFDAAWGGAGGLYEQRLGRSRADVMNPFSSLHDAGVRLAFGSDSPVTPFAPWAAVRGAVYHHNVEERLEPAVAFDAATAGGHLAGRRDGEGVLTPGAAATYAVWDVESELVAGLPQLAGHEALPHCVQTVVSGTVVFDELTVKEGS